MHCQGTLVVTGAVLLFATSESDLGSPQEILVYVIQYDSGETSGAKRQVPSAMSDLGLNVANLWHFDTVRRAIWNPRPAKLAEQPIQPFNLQWII